MATVAIQDTFTEGSDTALESHTPDTGGAWSKHPSYATGATVVASEDRLRGDSTSATSLYINATSPAAANYEVAWTARMTSTTNPYAGAAARFNATTNNGYVVWYSGGVWNLGVVVSGTVTTLATYNGSETTNTDYAIRWIISEDRHEVYFDGTLRMSVQDSTFLSAGKAGPYVRNVGRVDNFVVQSLDTKQSRLSQTAAEIYSAPDPNARLSQAAVEVFSSLLSVAELAQMAVEVFSQNIPAGPTQPVMMWRLN